MGILLTLIGGLLFLYFNIKCMVKISISLTYLHLYFCIIVFRKKHEFNKIIDFLTTQKIINRYKNPETRQKFRKKLDYFKYGKKAYKLFYIKNILFYPECIREKQSFAIEFVVVNRMLKKSILNG